MLGQTPVNVAAIQPLVPRSKSYKKIPLNRIVMKAKLSKLPFAGGCKYALFLRWSWTFNTYADRLQAHVDIRGNADFGT